MHALLLYHFVLLHYVLNNDVNILDVALFLKTIQGEEQNVLRFEQAQGGQWDYGCIPDKACERTLVPLSVGTYDTRLS